MTQLLLKTYAESLDELEIKSVNENVNMNVQAFYNTVSILLKSIYIINLSIVFIFNSSEYLHKMITC